MAEMVYAPRFAEELSRVTPKRAEDRIYDVLGIIEAIPTIGSTNIPSSIQSEFGGNVLKMVVDPFDIFYECFEEQYIVFAYTLILQRQAR